MEAGGSQALLSSTQASLADSGTMHHPFLRRFEQDALTPEQVRRFALQWYLTARRHKEAFPAIVLNTPDDDIRFELIEILRDEYGNGDPGRIHAKLLRRFVRAIGISDNEVAQAKPLSEVETFGDAVTSIWRDGEPAFAFGLHFALEFLATALHDHLAKGVAKCAFVNPDDSEYFRYHQVAELEHADYSVKGFLHYASEPSSRELLLQGVHKGRELLDELYGAFNREVFA